jgi:hypothetical protein
MRTIKKEGTMKKIAEKHQRKIAYSTLKMTPAMANIAGGMTYQEAYKFIFKTDLKTRLQELVDEYGNKSVYSWELEKYGWDNPSELLAAIN